MKRVRLLVKNAARYPGSFLVRLLCGAAALAVAGTLVLIIGYILASPASPTSSPACSHWNITAKT